MSHSENQPRVLTHKGDTTTTVVLALNDMDEASIMEAQGWKPENVTRVFHGATLTLHTNQIKTMLDEFTRRKEQGLDIFGMPKRSIDSRDLIPLQPLPPGALPIYDRNPDVSSLVEAVEDSSTITKAPPKDE